jgi:hypothetical protein
VTIPKNQFLPQELFRVGSSNSTTLFIRTQ